MFTRGIGLLLGLAITTTNALAEVRLTPPDPAADWLVAEALQKTPEVAAARAVAEAARRRIDPARTLSDPSASITYQNDGRNLTLGEAEGSFLGLMLSQPLPWPGKLALAGRAAQSEARAIELGTIGRAERSIEARVRNAWYDLILARAVDRLIEVRRVSASQIEAAVRERYATGLSVQQDVLRAQVELARVDELKATQQATITTRLAELNRVLGRAQDAAVDSPTELPAVSGARSGDEVITSVVSRSPEVAAAQQAIETGRVTVAQARRNFLPDLVVSGGSMYRGSFEMGAMWQAGVAISIPAWIDRRQTNQLAEARARLAGRNAESVRVSQELELRTRERLALLDAAQRIAVLYHDKIVPLDELSLESALASYQTGKVPFVTVLEALNTLFSDRTTLLGRRAEVTKWRIAIDEADLAATSMAAGPAMPAGGMGGGSAQTTSSTRSSNNNSMTSMR